MPWLNPWPSEDLEYIGRCPVCSSVGRTPVYKDLIDNVFRISPGIWSMWQCRECKTDYLDPRPSSESIHRAYKSYYTHSGVPKKPALSRKTLKGNLKSCCINGYVNWKLQSRKNRKFSLCFLLVFFIPGLYNDVQRHFRHLKPYAKGDVLLDIGCGDASYLEIVKEAGWSAVGLDIDPTVVENARRRGLNVYLGGTEYFDGQEELFDVITLSHVIEHVHDPVKLLADCHRLLKPGGEIWVETPNNASICSSIFGKNWRGLESPRHLVLFNHRSLRGALYLSGFNCIQRLASPNPYENIFKRSYIISSGGDPYIDKYKPSLFGKIVYRIARIISIFFRNRTEFITVKAFKD